MNDYATTSPPEPRRATIRPATLLLPEGVSIVAIYADPVDPKRRVGKANQDG